MYVPLKWLEVSPSVRSKINRMRVHDLGCVLYSINWFYVFIVDLSYNQPKFCPSASWNSSATVFADEINVGEKVYGLFVDASNTIYAIGESTGSIHVWTSGSINRTKYTFSNISLEPKSLFVALNGDIFIDNGENSRIEIWSVNATRSVSVLADNGSCYGLFVDLNNTIYCSMRYGHRIIKISLNNVSYTFESAIGEDESGSGPTQLYEPIGIFVDKNFTLYVADSRNNRIQRFQSEERNGTTVASNETGVEYMLNYPTGIALDADQNMFILDEGNHRIFRWGPNGTRCLLGCSSEQYSSTNPIMHPQSLGFDSYGNIFVANASNGRIMKLTFITNSCSKCTPLIGSRIFHCYFPASLQYNCIRHYNCDYLTLCFVRIISSVFCRTSSWYQSSYGESLL